MNSPASRSGRRAPAPESWIAGELARLDRDGLLRRIRPHPRGGAAAAPGIRLNLSSNDYLDLAGRPEVVESACRAAREGGAGSGASRLLSGTLPCHLELESALARLEDAEQALVFGSGYAANVGAVSALVSRGDWVIADRLAHASLIDGARLSGAVLRRFRHNDPGHLDELLRRARGEARRILVVTESVFSMDGDLAPLDAIAGAALERGAMLLVDEAHATGLFGPGGSGRVRELGLQGRITLRVGTLSKALGSFGGFVAGSKQACDWLANRARSFVYSTALPPSAAGAALGALRALESDPGAGARLLEKAGRFRRRLRELGLSTLDSASPIVPIPAGSRDAAIRAARLLFDQGIRVAAVRPPTVPPGGERLRASVSLAHADEALEEAAGAIAKALRTEPSP